MRARGLADRVALVTDRLKLEHEPLLRQLRLDERLAQPDELAAQVESDLIELPLRGDDELLDRLTREYRPSLIGRTLAWAVLLWFPFVQPVAEGMLEMSAAGTDLTDWLHGLYRVVVALGAAQLLQGLALVAVIYVGMLASIYGRCVRDVQSARTSPSGMPAGRFRRRQPAGAADLQAEIDSLAQEIDAILLNGVISPVLRPFEVTAAQLETIHERLSKLAG